MAFDERLCHAPIQNLVNTIASLISVKAKLAPKAAVDGGIKTAPCMLMRHSAVCTTRRGTTGKQKKGYHISHYGSADRAQGRLSRGHDYQAKKGSTRGPARDVWSVISDGPCIVDLSVS